MRRSLLISSVFSVIMVACSCGSGRGKINSTGEVKNDTMIKTSPGAMKTYHDTVNKKVEVANPSQDQRKTDSIKAEKTRRKK